VKKPHSEGYAARVGLAALRGRMRCRRAILPSQHRSDHALLRPVGQEQFVKYVRTRIAEARFLAAHSSYHLAERGADWFHFTNKAAG
jgi:hypothetical protein